MTTMTMQTMNENTLHMYTEFMFIDPSMILIDFNVYCPFIVHWDNMISSLL